MTYPPSFKAVLTACQPQRDSPRVPHLESYGFSMEMASAVAVSQFNNLIKHFNDFLGLMTTSTMRENTRQSGIKNLN